MIKNKHKKQWFTLLAALYLGIGTAPLRGQVSYSILENTLVETFDTLQTSGVETDWFDNSTLPGW